MPNRPSEEKTIGGQIQRPIVLVVEDDPPLMLAAVQMFEIAGAEVLVAFGSDEAIRILEGRSDVRLVFSELVMPGAINGLQLVQFIRDRWPTIELILVSASGAVPRHVLPLGCRYVLRPVFQRHVTSAMTEFGIAGNAPKSVINRERGR